jgi:putative transcriptional regulator
MVIYAIITALVNGCVCAAELIETSKADHRRVWSQKMSEAYNRIKQGLNEALAFAHGEMTGAVVHQIEVPSVDVAAIRASTGLSQSQFAKSIGVAKGTLLNWEHGRRHPTGPAQVLLAMIARRPSLVSELLAA